MPDGSPQDDAWLRALIARSALLPEQGLRAHWQTVVPWLAIDTRYELAAVLLEVEHTPACS
jgi:hypothetical protein